MVSQFWTDWPISLHEIANKYIHLFKQWSNWPNQFETGERCMWMKQKCKKKRSESFKEIDWIHLNLIWLRRIKD